MKTSCQSCFLDMLPGFQSTFTGFQGAISGFQGTIPVFQSAISDFQGEIPVFQKAPEKFETDKLGVLVPIFLDNFTLVYRVSQYVAINLTS